MSAVAATARALVGVRFRLHGRDPATGLDCVGVAAHALGADAVPTGYALRGGNRDAIIAMLDERMARATDRRSGDLLLAETGPGQLHLLVTTDGGFVHADAQLRRVVERPGEPPWPVLGAWRRGEE